MPRSKNNSTPSNTDPVWTEVILSGAEKECLTVRHKLKIGVGPEGQLGLINAKWAVSQPVFLLFPALDNRFLPPFFFFFFALRRGENVCLKKSLALLSSPHVPF